MILLTFGQKYENMKNRKPIFLFACIGVIICSLSTAYFNKYGNIDFEALENKVSAIEQSMKDHTKENLRELKEELPLFKKELQLIIDKGKQNNTLTTIASFGMLFFAILMLFSNPQA